MNSLSQLQDDFAAALLGDSPGTSSHIAALVSQAGFAVYRNGAISHAADALEANFPAVARLVGPTFFRAAAVHFVRCHPPRSPCLLRYGDNFPEFLRHFAPAADIVYLAGVARVDWMWTEAHTSAGDTVLDAAALAALTSEELAHTRIRPHVTARWAWFEEAPIFNIWQQNRASAGDPANLEWQSEGALLLRPCSSVESLLVDAATCAFLDRCAAGDCIQDAIAAALQMDERLDLQAMTYRLLTNGALAALERIHS